MGFVFCYFLYNCVLCEKIVKKSVIVDLKSAKQDTLDVGVWVSKHYMEDSETFHFLLLVFARLRCNI